ncbi:MAG: DUF86 domain-containing protein [Planctomycetaceae bacterium]|nr:DUF86 domain-containing protein [Planctomycetaceae bacterium]
MPPRRWPLRLNDIIDAAFKVERCVRGMTFDDFCSNETAVDAVIKNIIVIGEAAGAIPPEIVLNHPEIPWKGMKDMRNILVHSYFGTDLDVVWKTVTEILPPLVRPLQVILNEQQ